MTRIDVDDDDHSDVEISAYWWLSKKLREKNRD